MNVLALPPRERENIYENTQIPFKLIYVDGGSPSPIRDYLKNQAQEKGFQLICTEHYLFSNRARNIGLAKVDTKYVAFVDNDIKEDIGYEKKSTSKATK